jgi:cytidylate kinase
VTLVALSAAYGALGSRIGPALAERLGVPFLDRAIPLEVAKQLDVPVDDAVAAEEAQGGLLERVLRGFVGGETVVPSPMPADIFTSAELHRATEEVVRRHAASGRAVILGRGAVAVLHDDPRALRVRLHGPPDRRRALAMELGGVDEATAERALRNADRAHAAYLKRFYGVRLDDISLYHLVLDTTVIGVELAVATIAAAAQELEARSASHAGPA